MKVILIRAIRNLFVGQIDLKPQPHKKDLLKGEHYITKIELASDSEVHYFNLVSSKELLKQVSSVMLFEDEPDEETLKDMASEVTNLVIGNAKVLVEDVRKQELKLTIPKEDKETTLESIIQENSNIILFKFNGNESMWFLISRVSKKG
jgi:uncharacterized protein YneR